MNYKDIAWAAFIDTFIAGNNNKYVELFRNKNLINNMRQNPSSIPFKDFNDKVVSKFLNSWGKMYIQNNSVYNRSKEIYDAIIELTPFILQIGNDNLVTCNLSSSSTVCNVTMKIYNRLTIIPGISMVGFSKIAHILNDSLFPLIDNPIRKEYKKIYGISPSHAGYINWMVEMQKQACYIIEDFHKQGFIGSPGVFLSQQLGYTSVGCNKSLVKFLDEYYWLTITHGVTIPPKWVP